MKERIPTVALAWFAGLVLAVTTVSTATAGTMLDSGDEAPVFMLYSYNEPVATAVAGSNTPSLGNFLGVSPEEPRDAVLLVFLAGGGDTADELEMLARLQRKYSGWGRGLQVIVICVDAREADINDSLSGARSVNFPVLRDRFLVASDRYGVGRNDVPVGFLLVGERPNVALTPSQQAAIKDAYLGDSYHWTVRIVDRWRGGLLAQEETIVQGIETVLQP
ncbi:MAG: hypothetical protein CMJ87_13405 [Planctomycetes bacterium]|jgi:hypothetical protein|nr:hypothetical protein [Planctomycetota bacterium]